MPSSLQFADYDVNGDEMLAYAEFMGLMEDFSNLVIEDSPFHLADTDNDGYVSLSEAWLSFGETEINTEIHFTAFKLELQGCDADNDTVLNEDEFEHFWNMDPICDREPLYRYFFDIIDTDENKKISMEELNLSFIKYDGEVLSDEELKNKMDKFDKDGEGSWNYEEFGGWANAVRNEYYEAGNGENDDHDNDHDHDDNDHDHENDLDDDDDHVYDYDYIIGEFNDIDANGDGLVSAAELWEVYGYGDLETGINLIKADWAGCDKNADEVLNVEEFENYWNDECSSEDEEDEDDSIDEAEEEYEYDDNNDDVEDDNDTLETFREMDTNEDGFVSAYEYAYDEENDEEQIKLIEQEWKREGCDENHDELLDEEEFANYWNHECNYSDKYGSMSPFELADSDGDGFVSLSEAWFRFGFASNNTEEHFTAFRLEVEGCDLNNDEVLNEDEFERLWNGALTCKKDPLYKYLFSLMDADNDTIVTKNELNSGLSAYGGEAMSETELQTEIGEFDMDGEGTWTYEEFVGWLNASRSVGVNETDDNENEDKNTEKGDEIDTEYDVDTDGTTIMTTIMTTTTTTPVPDYENYDYDYSEIFKEVDTDEDGFVSAREIFDDYGYGDEVDEEEKENEIRRIKKELEEEGCDEDGDELLNMEEFVNYWNIDCKFSHLNDNGHEDGGEEQIVFNEQFWDKHAWLIHLYGLNVLHSMLLIVL